MITNKLLDWTARQNKKLATKFASNFDTKQEKIYAQTIKLTEEVGELNAEVLDQMSLQRDKGGEKSKDALAHEFADVVLCTLLLADRMDIDVNKALEEKIEKINKRFEDIK